MTLFDDLFEDDAVTLPTGVSIWESPTFRRPGSTEPFPLTLKMLEEMRDRIANAPPEPRVRLVTYAQAERILRGEDA